MDLTVSYVLDFAVYRALLKAQARLRRFGRYRPLVKFAVVAAAYLVIVAALAVSHAGPSALGAVAEPEFAWVVATGAAALMLLVVLTDIAFAHGVARLVFRRFALADRRIEVHLSDRRIAWSAEGLADEVDWERIAQMVLLPDHLVLFLGRIEGLTLPRSAFPAPADFEALAHFARQRIAPSAASSTGP